MSSAAATSTTTPQQPLEQLPAPPPPPQPAQQPAPQDADAQQQQEQQPDAAAPPPPPPQDEQDQEQQCHICMHDLTDPTAVKGCGHRFCRGCILKWVGSRHTQPVCPVCRAEVKVLVLEDGTEQEAEPAAAPPPAEAEPDLSCLDHGFFHTEVSRLLSRAESVHNRVYRDAYGCGRRGGACTHSTGRMLDGVQDVVDTLTGYRSTLEGEVRFDPHVLLEELYRLDRQLTSLQAGDSSSGDSAAASAAEGAAADPWQQQADRLAHMHLHHHDSEHEHDYDDSADDDDDDWLHEGLSRTPGRRPTQRQGTKHGRNNSGGGGSSSSQQPQQQRQHQQLRPQQRGPMPRWRQ